MAYECECLHGVTSVLGLAIQSNAAAGEGDTSNSPSRNFVSYCLMPEVLLVVLVGAAVVILIYLGHLTARKRREALSALAHELGWDFDPSRDYGHDDSYRQFDIFRRGRSRSAYNTLRGSLEIERRIYQVKTGDFRYTIKTGKSSTTYKFSYLILHLPFPTVPKLLVRRESVLDKLAGAVGFHDIDFESAEFSKRFYVKSSDKKFAYDVIHPRMMELLLSTDAPVLEIEHRACCLHNGTTRVWKVSDFRKRLWWARQFFESWPEYLTSALDAET